LRKYGPNLWGCGYRRACLPGITCAHPDARSLGKPDLHHLTKQARLAAIHRAQVWSPTNVPEMDESGTAGVTFTRRRPRSCDYRDKKIGGKSRNSSAPSTGHELKVKYGAETVRCAESPPPRLFWALGFPTDAVC
jgi:hypothetical protein